MDGAIPRCLVPFFYRKKEVVRMSVPIPPHDQASPLWRRLITALLLAVWPAGGLTFLLGSAAGEDSFLGRGFVALAEAPWWALAGACMALVSATLFALPASLRVAGDFVIGASSLALMTAWAVDPATTQVAGNPFWGYLLFFIGIAIVDAGITIQERRAARPPQGENGA